MDLEKLFHLRKNGTDVKTEILAGITTFMTMAYILAVNPAILSDAGMDKDAVFVATALIAFLSTAMMGLLANYPFALAPGIGLNAYFAYTIVIQMGYTWEVALAAVFVEGVIFIILSLVNVRESIFASIPQNLKYAISGSIGLFITFIGLQNANLVVSNPTTLVSAFSIKGSIENGTFNSDGIGVILAFIGIIIICLLLIYEIKGGILYGILFVWGLGMVFELIGIYEPNPEIGVYSLFPDFSSGIKVPRMSPTFMKMDFSDMFSLDFLVVVCALLMVDMFDTLGSLIGVASKANILDKNGKFPKIKQALLTDAIATTLGAVFGTSTTTTFVESAAGIANGGRTGLTSIVTSLLFAVSLFLSPIFLAVPSFATAPALIVVGFQMFTIVTKMDFSELSESLPGYICIVTMPFTYSISEGIALSVISYVIINVFLGGKYIKKIHPIMYILTLIFLLKYLML